LRLLEDHIEKLLSIQDAATLLSISPWTVRLYLKSGKLSRIRIGRRVLLEQSEIRRFIAALRNDTPKAILETQQ
jgi:excisionase family DNA binding protein